MNKRPELIDQLGIKKKCLDEIKQQTEYKIKYVVEYVREWLYVATNMENKNIIFIESMANAGIYQDGTIGTGPEVLKLFAEFAGNHKDKLFYLFVNDIDEDRLDAHMKLLDHFMPNPRPANIIIEKSQEDVNQYLQNYQRFDPLIGWNKSMCLMFIDPYNFRTVEIDKIQGFVKRFYCEVLFNVFTSDKVRNEDDQEIQRCLGDLVIPNGKDTINVIAQALKVGHVKYAFSYAFRIKTNIELYQIMFLTPNIRGLEKLKDAMWKVFDGAKYHKNKSTTPQQISLFAPRDVQNMTAVQYAKDAQTLLLENFSGREMSFEEINVFIVEETFLKSTHVISKVLRPMVKEGLVIKKGLVSGKNYKADNFIIGTGVK